MEGGASDMSIHNLCRWASLPSVSLHCCALCNCELLEAGVCPLMSHPVKRGVFRYMYCVLMPRSI